MSLYDQFANSKEEKIINPIIFPNMEIKTLPITPNAFEKMHMYRDIYDSFTGGSGLEFFGFMFRKTDSNAYGYKDINNHVIRNIILGKNQENTYAHTFLDAADVHTTLEGIDKKVWQLAGWTHRHPDGVTSSSSEDKGHNVTVVTEIEASNYLENYMTIPMTHLECEFKSNCDNGTEMTFFDKRDGSIYTMQTSLSLEDAKNTVPKFKDKQVPVKLAYAHSMIILRDRSPLKVYSEVITRKYSGNSLNYIQKNGQWDGQKTKIVLVPVEDDIILDEKAMIQEIKDCTYIPKLHESGLHINKGYAFGEKISDLAEKTGGGYFFIDKHQQMPREEFKELFAPFLKKRLEPEEYARWERRALHEVPIISKIPNILSRDIDIANKVLENSNTVGTATVPNTLDTNSSDKESLDNKVGNTVTYKVTPEGVKPIDNSTNTLIDKKESNINKNNNKGLLFKFLKYLSGSNTD
jgi:proteasome lid subunit RPN8/RPN11